MRRQDSSSPKTRPAPRRTKTTPQARKARPAARARPKAAEEKEEAPLLADTRLGPVAPLSVKQRCHLRGLGHHLLPIVQIGKDGITDELCEAAWTALWRHELIKLRVLESAQLERHEAAAELSRRLGAALVQVMGGTVLLYRRRPTDILPHVSLS